MNRTQWSAVVVILAIVAVIVVLWIGPSAQKGETPILPLTESESSTANIETPSEHADADPGPQLIETENAAPAPNSAPEKGRIRGTVRMSDGSPVPDTVSVALLGYDDASDIPDPITTEIARAAISPDAAFDFPDLPLGGYVIHAGNDDYTQHASYTLTADRFEFESNLTLYPGGAIAGRVIDESGKPVSEARVYVAAYHIGGGVGNADRERAIDSQVVTAEDGQFTMRHLRRSTDNDSGYKLAVIAEGFAPYTSDYVHAGTEDVEFVLSTGGAAQGQLVHYETREPLSDMTLQFRSGLAVGDRTVETGPDGWFFAPALATGEHKVELVDDELTLMPDSNSVAITPGRESSDLLLLAARGAIVTGHVRDSASGHGIPNAEVQLSGQRARTDARGAYRFAGLEGGDYRVSVGEVAGYARNSDRNSPNRRITVSPGVEFDGVDFELYRGLRVSGVVVDESGSPVPEARVNASTFGSNERVSDSATTDAHGRFSLAGFPPSSSLRIRAYKGELIGADEHLSFNITNTDLTGLTITVTAGATVSGHVFDQLGNPVEDLRLATRIQNKSGSSIVRTRADGSFTISRLLPGTYDIIHGQSPGRFSKSLHTFTVAKGQKLEGLRLQYETGGLSISGIVTDSNGQPLHPVAIVNVSDTFGSQTITDTEGRFTITGLEDKTYRLLATDQKDSMSETQNVKAGANDVRFVIKEKAAIEGVVVSAATGQPVTEFEIDDVSASDVITSYDPRRFQAVSHPEGRFTLSKVGEGSRAVLVRAEGYALANVTVPDLQHGEIRTNVLVRLDPEARIEGRVVDEHGNPIAGARVFLGKLPLRWQNNDRSRTTTDAAGAFELMELNTGAHEIWAVHTKFLPGSTQVTTTAGYSANALITLGVGGTIAGRITEAGKPVEAARVFAHQIESGSHRTQTSATGDYEISALSDGEYSVSVFTGRRASQIKAQVAQGMTTEVNVDFPKAAGRVYGRAVDSGGRPIPGQITLTVAVRYLDGLEENQQTKITSDGQYEFTEVPAGNVALLIHYNDRNHRSEFQLRDGQTLQHNIVIDEGATIDLRVGGIDSERHDATALAVPGEVDMSAFDRDFLDAFVRLLSQTTRQFRIRNGRADVTGLVPGNYTIIAVCAEKSDTGDVMAQAATARVRSTYVAIEKNGTYSVTLNF